MKKPIIIKKKRDCFTILVTGERDPRGQDVDINVYMTNSGELHISIPHTKRCYTYSSTEITSQGFTILKFI